MIYSVGSGSSRVIWMATRRGGKLIWRLARTMASASGSATGRATAVETSRAVMKVIKENFMLSWAGLSGTSFASFLSLSWKGLQEKR